MLISVLLLSIFYAEQYCRCPYFLLFLKVVLYDANGKIVGSDASDKFFKIRP